MKLDYNILSQDYDLTRYINIDTVKRLLSKLEITPETKILDFGCGTGNYACAIKKLTAADVRGVEPSDGMRQKAIEKNSGVTFMKGDHADIPAENGFFDLIYMTDVIHHVPDLRVMFREFGRILKPGGLICILTESHRQIESRYWSAYFPATVAVERARYPDIDAILEAAGECGLVCREIEVSDHPRRMQITPEFVRLVEAKGFSMFRLISDSEFELGLAALKSDFEKNKVIETDHGESFIRLAKPDI